MQRTKSKILSILLSLVMLLSLLPTTALATESHPAVGAVSVDDGKSFGEPGKLYYKNGDSNASFSGTSTDFNAAYDPDTGILTLQGYNGGSIIAGGATTANITIKLLGNNTVTGSVSSDMGGNITITSDSSGELSITNILSGNNTRAIGIAAGLAGNYQTGNVTIMGDAKVIISATNNNNVINYAEAYGIFAKENITISGDASAEITCATPNNTYSNIYCNGLRADKNVTINTDGTIKINVIAAGNDDTQSYGIYPMGNATLTKVGEMEVQWKKHKTNTSYPGGVIKGGGSFDTNTHAVNVDETNCYASYRFGTPYTVTVENGTLAGPGVVLHANNNGNFLAGDKVTIKPEEKKGKSNEVIPFKEWTSEQVTFTDPTAENNSFNVPANAVTVTAKHNPFVGAPTFTPTGATGTEGTLTFTTVVDPYDGSEGFYLVKEVDVDTTSKYISISPSKTSTGSPHVYSNTVYLSTVPAGNYYVIEKLNNAYYPSEKFTVNYSAAPTVTYPDHVRVFNASGDTTSLSDGECLTANDAGSASSYTGGSSYVARYDSGKLYLKDYHGVAADDKIFADGDLNIVVESDSSFTTSTTATNHLYGIQADGKLNISGPGKLTVTANGNGDVYGIYANEGVTISAPLDLTVGKVDSSKNGPVYGIYAQSGAISLDGNDMIVTATGGTEAAYGVYNAADTPAIAGNGNIGISGKLTVNLSNGSNNRGISSQGGVITLDGATVKIPGNYYYGIFNNNGNVVIKSSPDVDISSDISGNNGICTYEGGDLTIENSTVKVSANGHAANLKGNVSIKDSTVELTLTANYYEVIRTGNSSAANTIDLSGNGSVTLTASGKQEYAMISGKVSLGTNTKLEKGTPDGNSYDGVYDTASNTTVLKFVHEATTPAANISLSETGTMDFGSMEAGYTTAPAAKTVTITNNGTAATGPLTIALEGTNAGSFTVSPTSITDIASGGDTDTFTVQPNTGLSAGTYTATVKVSGTGVTEQSFDVKFTVTAPATPITDMLVTVSDLTGKTYNESAQEPTFGGGLIRDIDYTVSYAVKPSSTGTLNSDGKPVGAGTYVVTVTGKGNYTSSFIKEFEIGKATPVYTAPTAKTGLAYTGSALDLIDAGTVTKGGEMQYNLDGGSYGPGIPAATDAGDYTVRFKIDGNDNYNAVTETQVGTGAINIAQVEWGTPTETLTPVNPTTAGGSDGKITGTTSTMQYKKSDGTWTDCTGDVTGLYAGTYYVRYKADGNHTASDTNYKTVTLTDPGTTLYGVTVTDGTAAPTGDQAAGTEVTITANTKTGFNFKEWTGLADSVYKTGSTKASNPATFIMPASAVNVTATYEAAALTGTASITGTLKYGQELTATLTGSNNTGNLDYKWYQNGTTQVAANNTGKYTLRAEDINKTITVKITSSVQTGEITGTTTGTIDKADGPAAPAAFTLSFTLNSDGTTYTATIPTVAGGEYSFDGTNYSATNSKADCAANTGYTGYVRIAETSTHKASTATSSMQTSPKLTVATPTFTPNGASGFTGTQSVTISCTTAGAKIYYTTDGTTPTTASTLYTTALSLTSTTTVKAIAVNTGMNDSAIATATFTKYSGGGGGGGGSYTPSYTVSVDKTENGTITVSPKSASKGDAVTITVKPDKGYTLETITVTDKNGDEIELTNKGDGKYTFKMPAGKVYVEATFMEDNSMLNFFVDVPADAYYYDAVLWAAKNGITGGVDDTHFAPNATCTRAQIVTFLWRAAGSPAPKNSMMPFTDVSAGSYYEQAVLWAVENGITDGTSATTFSPDAVCSRGQIVTFLWRSQKSPASDSVNPFADVAADDYYNSAVLWAAENGITGGTTATTFSPNNDCTRAQIVTFLYRCLG